MEVDEPNPEMEAEAAARTRQLHAEAQARYRERQRAAEAEAQAARLAEAAAAQQATAAAYKEARRAAWAMKKARQEQRAMLWDDLHPSCRAAASKFGFMRGIWNHRNSQHGSALGVSSLIRHEWWHPWNELPKYFKQAAIDLGYDRVEWQTEELGCPSSGYGCTQRFQPGETESDFEVNDDGEGSVCSDSCLFELSPRSCFTTVTMDTMDLLAESCRSYCDGPSASYRPSGGCYVGGRVGDIHDGAEYTREEWSQMLRGL